MHSLEGLRTIPVFGGTNAFQLGDRIISPGHVFGEYTKAQVENPFTGVSHTISFSVVYPIPEKTPDFAISDQIESDVGESAVGQFLANEDIVLGVDTFRVAGFHHLFPHGFIWELTAFEKRPDDVLVCSLSNNKVLHLGMSGASVILDSGETIGYVLGEAHHNPHFVKVQLLSGVVPLIQELCS